MKANVAAIVQHLLIDSTRRENGIGVRSAVGVGSLPENVPVEIEAIFELNEEMI